MRHPRVEILYFEGCPNYEATRTLVERVAAQLRVEPEITLVDVGDADAAAERHFLGSPSVRVDGRDIEPGAEEREAVFSCRVYPTEHGFSGQPGEGLIREALVQTGEFAASVSQALAWADIPSSKLGRARWARLTDLERELYFWILRRFAEQGRPSKADLSAAAKERRIDVERALEALAREDLVHCGDDGEITVAYPFSGRPTAHRVRFPSGHEVDAMCAIDALGIAPMVGEAIEVSSRDPRSGAEIRLAAVPSGPERWSPEGAVVVAGMLAGEADSCRGCCPALNFFGSSMSAEHWLEEHPQVRGRVISIEQAAAAGRAVFGGVLD